MLLGYILVSVFQRRPPTPPSRAQEIALQISEQNYGQTLKRLLTNRWFLLLLLSYGRLFLFLNLKALIILQVLIPVRFIRFQHF